MSEGVQVQRRGMRALLLSIIAAAGAYLGFALWGGWRDVAAALEHVSLLALALLLSLSLLNYGLRFVRWHYYLGRFGYRLPVAASLRIYLSGFALTTTPGKAGEALRCVLLQPRGVAYPHSLAALLAERLGDLLAVLVMAGLGLSVYPQGRGVLALLTVALAMTLLLIQRRVWLEALDRYLRRRFSGRIGSVLAGTIETVLHSARLFTLPLLLFSLLLGLCAWGSEAVAFHYLVHLLGTDISLRTALFIYAFSMLVGAVSFLPGGLGSAELTMVALLVLNGMSHGDAVAATVLIRLTTLWFAVFLGLAALLPVRGRTGV